MKNILDWENTELDGKPKIGVKVYLNLISIRATTDEPRRFLHCQ